MVKASMVATLRHLINSNLNMVSLTLILINSTRALVKQTHTIRIQAHHQTPTLVNRNIVMVALMRDTRDSRHTSIKGIKVMEPPIRDTAAMASLGINTIMVHLPHLDGELHRPKHVDKRIELAYGSFGNSSSACIRSS